GKVPTMPGGPPAKIFALSTGLPRERRSTPPILAGTRQDVGRPQRRPPTAGTHAHRRHVHALGRTEPAPVFVAAAAAKRAAPIKADAHLPQSMPRATAVHRQHIRLA